MLSTVARMSAALLLGTAAVGPAVAANPDPFFPEFGNTGYGVDRYSIDIDATELPAITASATIDVVAHERLTSMSLDLRDALEVSRVTVEGGIPAQFVQRDDKLTITLPEAVESGARLRVDIDYAGIPDPLPDPTYPNPQGELPLGWLTTPAGAIYALSEPVGASSWYPANDVPTDKAKFSFEITVPEGVTAAANGLPRGVIDNGDTKTFRFSMRQPMTTWLATIHINNFRAVDKLAYQDIAIRNYISKNVSDQERALMAETPNYMEFMARKVGPYPFDSYGNVVVDDPNLYYALETQTLSTYPSDFVEEGVLVHELAHQWFGDAVTIRHWDDIWIAEGFATYFEYLYPNRDDPAAFDETMRSLYAYCERNNIGKIVIDSPFDLFSAAVYYRAGVMLYALQLKVGDDVFFDIVQEFYKTNRNKNVSTQAFIDTAVSVSGDQSVRPLLRAWLFEDALPSLGGTAQAARVSADQRAAMGEALVKASKSRHRPFVAAKR